MYIYIYILSHEKLGYNPVIIHNGVFPYLAMEWVYDLHCRWHRNMMPPAYRNRALQHFGCLAPKSTMVYGPGASPFGYGDPQGKIFFSEIQKLKLRGGFGPDDELLTQRVHELVIKELGLKDHDPKDPQ